MKIPIREFFPRFGMNEVYIRAVWKSIYQRTRHPPHIIDAEVTVAKDRVLVNTENTMYGEHIPNSLLDDRENVIFAEVRRSIMNGYFLVVTSEISEGYDV